MVNATTQADISNRPIGAGVALAEPHLATIRRARPAARRPATASGYVWETAIEHLTAKLGYLLRKQGIVLT